MARKPSKQSQLRELPDVYFDCRSYRYHALQTDFYFHFKAVNGKGTCRVSTCIRCSAIREDYLLPSGELLDRRYYLPDGYTMKGVGRVRQADVNRELLRRLSREEVLKEPPKEYFDKR